MAMWRYLAGCLTVVACAGGQPDQASPEPPEAPEAAAEAPAPDAAADAGGTIHVKVATSGKGTVQCGPESSELNGPTAVAISGTLPVSCMVTIDDKRGVFQVHAAGAVTCNVAGEEVVCDPASVE